MITFRNPAVWATAFAGALLFGSEAKAQDLNILPGLLSAGGVLDNPDPDVVFSIGLGAGGRPAYFGSDEYEYGATGSFQFDYVRFPNGFSFGSANAVGFSQGASVVGSVRYIDERISMDYPEIDGLDDIDRTFEVGMGVAYEQEYYRAYGAARYGFFGHEAFVGELGADYISRPVRGLTLTVGPRIELGDSKFTDTYFGVTPEESVESGLDAYSAGGGLYSAGLEATALYQFNPLWGVRGRLNWSRLLDDAADSPITLAGDDDQFRIKIELIRRIALDF